MCNNFENWCGWMGELRSLDDHLTTCGYTIVRCTNKCMEDKKEVRILRRDLDQHLKNECPNRQYQCRHCETIGRYCDITTTHLDTCPKVKIPCPSTHCKALVARCNLSDHLTACEYTLLHCPNKCMENKKEVKILRCDLDHHLKDACPNCQHQCPHCKDTGRYCDITTTHLYTCPKVKIPCPNSDCKALVAHCELANHRSKCQFEKVPCKYAGIGCEEELLRKDLEQHEMDDAFHLHLAIETVNKQQSEISKQREEINEQREEINKQRVEISKQREEMNEQQEEMKAVKAKQKIMSDSIIAAQTGPCVFKMPDFSRYKSSKQEWYCRPFYSHPGGYKMCVRVDANGYGDGADTHVSVFVSLMKGRNDDNLPWPFTGKISFTLLNQLGDKNHHTRTISLQQDNEAGWRVVEGEFAATGFGYYTFISHNKLYAPWNCQYLKDNCLYFRVKVQVTNSWLTCTV